MKKDRTNKEKEKKEKENLLEYREGATAGENLSDESDITSGADSVNAADTTAYPTYINEKGDVTHGHRIEVDQNVPPGSTAGPTPQYGRIKKKTTSKSK